MDQLTHTINKTLCSLVNRPLHYRRQGPAPSRSVSWKPAAMVQERPQHPDTSAWRTPWLHPHHVPAGIQESAGQRQEGCHAVTQRVSPRGPAVDSTATKEPLPPPGAAWMPRAEDGESLRHVPWSLFHGLCPGRGPHDSTGEREGAEHGGVWPRSAPRPHWGTSGAPPAGTWPWC